MANYKILTIKESLLVWTCKASQDSEVWVSLETIKNLPITELKKLYKIEKLC
jgi:hypothetical protein